MIAFQFFIPQLALWCDMSFPECQVQIDKAVDRRLWHQPSQNSCQNLSPYRTQPHSRLMNSLPFISISDVNSFISRSQYLLGNKHFQHADERHSERDSSSLCCQVRFGCQSSARGSCLRLLSFCSAFVLARLASP